MKISNFEPGDIILTRGYRIMIWFMRLTQRDDINWGHAMIVQDKDTLIEADWKVRRVSMSRFLKREKVFKILRMKDITPFHQQRLVQYVCKAMGQSYSFKRLFAQAFDNLFGTNRFTNKQSLKDRHICSSLVAWAYFAVLGYEFHGVPWRSCEPDDIDDDSEMLPYRYSLNQVINTKDVKK